MRQAMIGRTVFSNDSCFKRRGRKRLAPQTRVTAMLPQSEKGGSNMKRITKKRIATFAAGLALAALVNTPAFPQSQGRQTKQPVVAGIIKVPRQVRINPNRNQVAPGDSSHQDKPFVMLDPNGKPISPNAVYARLNGKTEGKDVIGYLNRTGKKLEEHGYSLNSKMVQVKTVQNNSKPEVISARHVSRMMPRLKSIAEIENEIRADIQRVS